MFSAVITLKPFQKHIFQPLRRALINKNITVNYCKNTNYYQLTFLPYKHLIYLLLCVNCICVNECTYKMFAYIQKREAKINLFFTLFVNFHFTDFTQFNLHVHIYFLIHNHSLSCYFIDMWLLDKCHVFAMTAITTFIEYHKVIYLFLF